MSTRIPPKNVHENSPKKRSFHGQNVHEKTATQLNDIFNDYISHLNQTCGYNSEAQITDTQCMLNPTILGPNRQLAPTETLKWY